MNSILAWFITFNFVNIAWVFFRAKEWDDAIKVLKGMFGFSGIILPNVLSGKLAFLSQYGINFGGLFENINGDKFTLVWILIGLLIVVFFKNSIERSNSFIMNYQTSIFSGLIFVYAVLSLNKVSEFLYFNF